MNKPTEKQRKTIHAEQIAPQNKRKKEPIEKQRKAIPQDRRHHGSVGANKPNEKLRKTTSLRKTQIIANGRRFSKKLLTLLKKRLFCAFYSLNKGFANRLAGSLPSNFLKIFKNFSGWNVRFVLAECLDRLGKRSDRRGNARIILAACLVDPQCFERSIMKFCVSIYISFLKLVFQKPFVCALHFRLSFYMIRNLYLTQMR